MSEQPSYREKIKEKFPGEKIDEIALSKAYKTVKEVLEFVTKRVSMKGEEIPPYVIEAGDNAILYLYTIWSALNRLEAEKFSKK